MALQEVNIVWVIIIVTTVILLLAGFFLAVVIRSQKKFISMQEEKLRESERLNETLLLLPQQILLAQEEERKRVARELHDGVSQMLASLKYRIFTAKLQSAEGQDRIRKSLDAFSENLDGVLEEVKRLSGNLHPKTLDDLGIIAALRSLCEDCSHRSGVQIQHDFHEALQSLPKDTQLGIYRITQEAMQNIHKHSHATRASINTSVDDEGNLHLIIADNGCGIPPAAKSRDGKAQHPGLGLQTMKERAILLGGTLTIQSEENKGTAIQLHLCLPAGSREISSLALTG